ncbi:ABC transporter ATP-binding protein [Candidatus Omnitrophota bacterium]
MKKILNKTQFKLFLKFAKYLLPYWKKEVAILSLSGLTVLLALVSPYLSKLVIDRAFGNRDLKIFIILALIGGGVFVLSGLVGGLKNYLDRQIKIKVNFDLNKKVFKHLEKLDLRYFQNKSTGEHLYRSSYDIDRASDFITSSPPQVVLTFPKLLFILVIVFRLNWQMALFSIFLAPLLYLPSYYFIKRMEEIWKELIKNSEGIFKCLNEFFSHIQLVKAFGKEATAVRGYLRRRIANIRISMRNVKLEVASGFAGSVVNKVAIGLIAFYGGYQVIKGRMSLGSLSAIMMYIGQLIGLQGTFAGFFQNIALGLVSCQRVEEILDKKAKIVEKQDAKDIAFKKGNIAFRDVIFGYKDGEEVISGINFDIKGGTHIAFVGTSGSGKSTILNLILRLYDPWSGDIWIDGYNVKDLKLSSLRSQIGIVLQEPFLWNDTIESNIKYGRPDASEREMIEAAKICGIDDFVSKLSNGYKTIIGENACKISEGQKQKIAIARALIKKPKILILDEALSSIDSQGEERIITNIGELQEVLTVIIVSHRLSTVMNADKIYFLQKSGEIVVSSGKELLGNKTFCNLFLSQLQDYPLAERFA